MLEKWRLMEGITYTTGLVRQWGCPFKSTCHHQVIIPVTKGQLDLGPWQQVYYAEFDGQRKKE